jgi:hypothetical protein
VRTTRQTCKLGQAIACHRSFTISSNGPRLPSPQALPSVSPSYTGPMARRWTKPMANLFPATTMMYSIPYRVTPTLPNIPTMSPDDPEIGQHKFAIRDPTPPTTTFTTAPSPYYVSVQDDLLPFSAETNFTTPLQGITWTLYHMSRLMTTMPVEDDYSRIELLQKYLTNIVQHPDVPKYRQLQTAAHAKSGAAIWNSPMWRLLLALGFIEEGPYVGLGCCNKPLSRDRIQDVALLSYFLTKWKNERQQQQDKSVTLHLEQPEGADGFGCWARLGWGGGK